MGPRRLTRELAERGGRLDSAAQVASQVRHGRAEVRLLWALADPQVTASVGSSGTVGEPWPHLQQICRVERRRTQVRRGKAVGPVEVEVTYAITSQPPERASAAALLQGLRDHWTIENGVHWVRDVTWEEDRSQVRSGSAPEVMAACRNLALGFLRRHGCANIAAALRTYAGRPAAALQLVLSAGSP